MSNSFSRFISFFFFSNVFLAITAIFLCLETNITTGLTLNNFPFYVIIFLGTLFYYTMIYVKSVRAKYYNERTLWYQRNLKYLTQSLKYIITAVIAVAILILLRNRNTLTSLTYFQWALLISFPLLALLYNSSTFLLPINNIRRIGVLKPFIIGLTWSGFVTFYPVFIWQIQKETETHLPLYPPFLHWLQNFLFISALAIIFDCKDFKNDSSYYLKTFPVLLGIKKTIYVVLLPLLLLNILVASTFILHQHFNTLQCLMLLLPYLLLIGVIFSIQRPKKLLYYLAGVDGLMLIKAICGITAIIIK